LDQNIYENKVSCSTFHMTEKECLTNNIQSQLHYCCLDMATQEEIKWSWLQSICDAYQRWPREARADLFPLGAIRASLKAIGKLLLTLVGPGFPLVSCGRHREMLIHNLELCVMYHIATSGSQKKGVPGKTSASRELRAATLWWFVLM